MNPKNYFLQFLSCQTERNTKLTKIENLIEKKGKRRYSVLVKDVDNDDEFPIVLAVVNESHPPDLDVSLERLSKQKQEETKQNEIKEERHEVVQTKRVNRRQTTSYGRGRRTRESSPFFVLVKCATVRTLSKEGGGA